MTNKIIKTYDFFGAEATFEILWETVFMTCTFAVGIQTDKRNELSIFHVTNYGGSDVYTVLDTCFLNVYKKYNYSIEEKVKKEMAKVITKVLTARAKAGMITIDQIKKWAHNS